MSKTTDKNKLSSRARLIPKDQRHQVPPEAMEPKNIKVRISTYLDLDVLEFFKARASEPGAAPYQTQINAALRGIMEQAGSGADPATSLRQAKGLIDAALRKIG